ncbi:MAG: squalene synthase HpnC [Acidobacteria bacterium]|nr:squalene synthase HpnC [Acidobacteriota bacterium]
MTATNSQAKLRAAYAECQRLARRHYENFPVASLLVPRDRRDVLAAIYAFARSADDFADEPGVEGRLTLLADWRRRLYECAEGKASDPVFLALGDAIRTYNLSLVNLDNLLRAFESDVRQNRHQDFASLINYSKYSANPVGRLVLELFGHREPELLAWSDDICTALQLTNFWQDVRIDLEHDRIYLPLEDLARFNISLEDLRHWGLESQREVEPDSRWRDLMAFEVGRTWNFFTRGKPLAEKVVPELRRQLRLTWLTGTAILARIGSVNYDVFNRRPKLGWFDFLRLYVEARHPLISEAAGRAREVAAGPGRRT